MHRVGSQRRLELATACSDLPTNAQCKCNAHAISYTNFVAIVEVGQLVVMVACGGCGLLPMHTLNSEVKELFQRCDAPSNHFVCTSSHNAIQAKMLHSLEHIIIVNPPLDQ